METASVVRFYPRRGFVDAARVDRRRSGTEVGGIINAEVNEKREGVREILVSSTSHGACLRMIMADQLLVCLVQARIEVDVLFAPEYTTGVVSPTHPPQLVSSPLVSSDKPAVSSGDHPRPPITSPDYYNPL